MPVTKVLARGTLAELNTGTVGVPVWTGIAGINSITHAPAANDADTTTFDEAGRQSHLKASRGDEFTVACLRLEDEATGDRDPGQEACEAWGDEIGQSSRKQFRFTSPGGNVIGPFEATATVTQLGGGNDDAATWQLAVKVSGALNP